MQTLSEGLETRENCTFEEHFCDKGEFRIALDTNIIEIHLGKSSDVEPPWSMSALSERTARNMPRSWRGSSCGSSREIQQKTSETSACIRERFYSEKSASTHYTTDACMDSNCRLGHVDIRLFS
ncbi:hypothetical protein PoB_001692000 [Plakobranchus ocellatus]|uniref:Uncharacterized protein n=1 Tax=Plakobranchus ocellatus TaxID=259542 RepID=A0AAV3Z783_9GAST|nr:hypothetical protein PoB_001692000 [Plakobranchus ocellatus]